MSYSAAFGSELLPYRQAIHHALHLTESQAVQRFSSFAPDQKARDTIVHDAADLIRRIRTERKPSVMELFLGEYGLSTDEGIALMCLTEAMLRVPDAQTIDELIEDKVAGGDWSRHLGHSSSALINASTWGLMLTGKILSDEEQKGIFSVMKTLVRRASEPVIRKAVGEMLKVLGTQFVLGQDIDDALRHAQTYADLGYCYSYDMLGEAARTEADAVRYHEAYRCAIEQLSQHCHSTEVAANPGISVKLSALYSRYEYAKKADVMAVLVERTVRLAELAARANMGLNIDAEEVDRLDLSLDVIEAVLADARLNTPQTRDWQGFGIVVQAYGKRAPEVLAYLNQLAQTHGRRLMVRLVKGAYWDGEIKRAQVLGLKTYPVYTAKVLTDISYLSSAQQLLQYHERIYPQFATHNAHTTTAVLAFIDALPTRIEFELQRLHGMGESLHEIVREQRLARGDVHRCRIYAPVGKHRDLLAYLVRRLLENGANGSFVNQLANPDIPPETVVHDPWAGFDKAVNEATYRSAIALPQDLYVDTDDRIPRQNSQGWDLTDPMDLAILRSGSRAEHLSALNQRFAQSHEGEELPGFNPAKTDEFVGYGSTATLNQVDDALTRAQAAFTAWSQSSAAERAALARRLADEIERQCVTLFDLLTFEAGKTLADAVAEVREAVDFCRYYAQQVDCYAASNTAIEPRGVVVAISPWNFPLAIFTGQVIAAAVAGNTVIAKPAEQTPLIARAVVELMHQVGFPTDVVQLLCGDGAIVGAALTRDPRVAGVVFTGSTDTAKHIEASMAQHLAPDAMLIAETGGLNAMIVDSSALPEQVVRDIMASAFQSAGQRCSALRIVYLQADIADAVIEMLIGAMATLTLGDPWDLATDVGPVIDQAAYDDLQRYILMREAQGRLVHRLVAPKTGYFVPPTLIRVDGIAALEREQFGPILHFATFDAAQLDQVIDDINRAGYGLTLGVHSRIDRRITRVCERAHIGNIYVNRNQIGAVVGSQPFGGQGLSGTGPKAGGPLYVERFLRSSIALNATPEAMVSSEEQSLVKIEKLIKNNQLSDIIKVSIEKIKAFNLPPINGIQSMPSPTGESNDYSLLPRGTVLCLGNSNHDDFIFSVLLALSLGNRVVVVSPFDGIDALQSAGLPLTIGDKNEVDTVDAVMCWGDSEQQRTLRQRLVLRQDKIVPLITGLHEWMMLVHEKHVCTDTTAAGGNAELLATVSEE